MTDPILTPEQVAQQILAGPIRDYTGLGKGCYCSLNYECGDCAIGRAIAEAFRQRAAKDAATIARMTQERDEARADRDRAERVSHSRRDDLLKAEAALATLREATMWQPIATAPKDGASVLGIDADRITGEVRISVMRVMAGWSSFTSVPGDYPRAPFAWMPLPTPPPEEPR